MGLDMWIRKVQKTKKDLSNIKTVEDLRKMRLNFIHEADMDDGCEDLKAFCTVVECTAYKLDMDKINKTFDLSTLTGYAYLEDSISFTDCNGKKIQLPYDQIEKEFEIATQEKFYVFEESEVHYWRKAYDIQDCFYESYPITNCGFTEISKGFLEFIKEEYDSSIEIPELAENEALFYHEWY